MMRARLSQFFLSQLILSRLRLSRRHVWRRRLSTPHRSTPRRSQQANRAAGGPLSPDAGVTLIEMLVVIVIIGLIAAIVAINVLPAQTTARIEKAKADLRTLEQALELFHLDQGRFPSTEEGLRALVTPPASTPGGIPRTEPYIRALPNDPWGRPYIYIIPSGQGRPYDLRSLGADGKEGGDGADADIGL